MGKADPEREKRQSVRFHILSLVKLAGESGDIPLQVTNIRNISRGGLAFLTEQLIPVGAVLKIYFLPANRKDPIEVRGKVVRYLRSPQNEKVFKVGVQFLEVSEDAKQAIQELEASFLAKEEQI